MAQQPPATPRVYRGESKHGHEEDAASTPQPAVEPDFSLRPQLASDAVTLLMHRERARHHSELAQTREQILALSSSSTESLFSTLNVELAAVATTAIRAMSVLQRDLTDSLTPLAVEELSGATGGYLARVASLNRSLLAIHLTLEARVRSSSS